MNFPALLALSLVSGSYAFGPGSVRTLEIVNKNLNLDGFPRDTVLAGGTFPGPPILANKGERLLVNVVDSLTDPAMLRSTSIHWHGISQSASNWEDGTAFVTQCPIAANNSFLYDFTPSGTFWYHSHLSTQYIDGLRGPLVIYDPNDPHKSLYDVDNADSILTLADWYHTLSLNAPFPLLPTSTLINGKGRYSGGPASPLSVVSVTSGLRYRFRLIAMTAELNFIFSIDGHLMTIIEADGVSTQPLEVDSIQIYAGQRYSFVLKANQKIDNYWIRSVPNENDPGFDGGINSAILRYVHAPNRDPTTTNKTSTKPLLETNLHPLVPVPVPGLPHPGGADVLINLNITLDLTAAPKYLMNGVSFTPPSSPALLQILSGAQAAQDLMPTGSYYALPRNKVIEISIPGASDLAVPHPFHLHGHTFHVVRSAGSSAYNYKDPVIRDVVNTGTAAAGDNVTFRFVTDNPGPWFLHCHIDVHLDVGLAVVLAEDMPTTAKEVVPSAWKDLCPTYDALTPNQL
ncbi:laccase [Mycena haematopus]|nr:laccase [Mycena haematopus]